MGSVKTAISIEKKLYDRINQLAGEMQVPRSRLFVIAIEEYLRREETRRLLSRINEAYEDYPDEEEQACAEAIKRKQRQNLGEERW